MKCLQLGQDMGQTATSFKRGVETMETEGGVAKPDIKSKKSFKKWRKSKKKRQSTEL